MQFCPRLCIIRLGCGGKSLSAIGLSSEDGAIFGAFVSYCHTDRAEARRLHHKLETYRLPKRLRRASENPKRDGSLGQIFRDREDLSAAEDLTASVKQALASSRALIVLCTPPAKNSVWVEREITLYRELHPDRPILAALLYGEPDDSFPAALREGKEPLAADFRKQGDGPRLAFLKVVAGVAGVPLDALIQREAQRQIQSVMAVTGLVSMVTIAMAAMTTIAIQARNEAQFQRDEAEGLVDYLLSDLRDELKGVGRLDVMKDVNERAMKYYEVQNDLNDMPAESLDRRARILRAMGEDDLARNDLRTALSKFLEANRVTEALLAKDARNPDRVFAHAQSAFWIGAVYFGLRDKPKTQIYWNKYRELSIFLQKLEPNSVRSVREIGYAEENLCALALDEPMQPTRALVKCGLALSEMQKLNKLVPSDFQIQEDLANRYGWFADAWKANGNYQEALDYRQKQLALLTSQGKVDPSSFRVKELLMKAHYAAAETAYQACRIEQARQSEKIYQDIAGELVAHDPDNGTWKKFQLRHSVSNSKPRSCIND